jgi:excisionase family DNA binding protein
MNAAESHANATNEQTRGGHRTTQRCCPVTARLPTLIDIDMVASHLGVSVRHIRRLIDERRIPFVKVGKFVRFDVDEVAQWVDEHRTDVLERVSVRGPVRTGGR